MSKVAVLGQGRMGAAMAVRLREAGLPVTVWNRDPRRCEPAVAAGASAAATAAEAVARASTVLVMLADGPVVVTVLAEAAPALAEGAVVAQLSTIAPAEIRALATDHPELALVDAPVKGSVPQVRSGSLQILVGGAAADVAAVRPVLEHLGSIRDCGRLGAGSAAKLVVNAAMISAVAALAESLRLAAGLGLTAEAARELLGGSPLAATLERHVPGGGAFPLYLAAKDLRLAHQAVPDLPLLAAAEADLIGLDDPQSGLFTAVSRALARFDAD